MQATAPEPRIRVANKPYVGALLDVLTFLPLALILSFALVIVSGLVFGLVNSADARTDPYFISLGLSAAFVGLLAASVTTFAIRGASLRENEPAALDLKLFVGVFVAAGLAQAAAILFLRTAESLGLQLQGSNVEPLRQMLQTTPLLTWLMVVLIAPFSEELFFRHILLRRFVQHGYRYSGLIISSLGFGLIHEIGSGASSIAAWFLIVLIYSAVGWVFAEVYLRSGRLWASVACHGISNAIALTLLGYGA